MKTLLLDIGNSRIKFATTQAADLKPAWALPHEKFAADFPQHCLSEVLLSDIEKIIWCSVASAAQTQAAMVLLGQHYPGASWVRFTSDMPVPGFYNAYQPAHSLGADRFAAAIGARAHQKSGPLLIASFGTATTLDVLSTDNHFLGGVILPGISAMHAALQQHTQLPAGTNHFLVPDATEISLIPNHTNAAIQYGILSAQLGALKHMHANAEQCLGASVAVLMTGGAAPSLQTYWATHATHSHQFASDFQLVDNLVLHGLRFMAMEHL